MTKMDKDIWLNIRKGKITLKQLKTRILERMDGYKNKFTDFDDLKDKLVP